MKRLLLLTVVAGTIIIFDSCTKKCYKCDFGGGKEPKTLCPDQFPDGRAGQKMTIDAYRQQGYKCVEE